MWLLSLFQRKRVPNCVVPRVWFVGEAVGPWASLGRALSAPTVLVCLTDRCQAHGCHHDLSDRCSNSAKVILSFAKALTLIFRRKKKCFCLSTPKSLCCPPMGNAQHCRSLRAPYRESPSRNHRASQCLHTLSLFIRAEAALPRPVTSPVSFLNHRKTLRVFTCTILTLLQNLSFRSGIGILPPMGKIQTCGLFFQTKFHWKAATLFCSSSVHDFSLCTAIE